MRIGIHIHNQYSLIIRSHFPILTRFVTQSVGQLPEAEQRLYICEKNFKRSYGDNLDRVVALKGNAANERALIMRLHLLQAVIMYHQNRRPEAASMLQLAEAELARLHISESALTTLVEMGYRVAEARVALRACGGSVEEAVGYVLRQREERAAARLKSRAEARLLVGKSRDKTWVNPRSLHALLEMGFEKQLCEVALRKTDNDLQRAVGMLQNQAEALRSQYAEDFLPDQNTIDAMVAMGFELPLVMVALQTASNNMDRAVDIVMRMMEGVEGEQLLTNIATAASTNTAGQPTTSSAAAAERLSRKLAEELARKRIADEAFDRFAEDIDDEDDDYLDLTLAQETKVVTEYKRYLNQ